MDTLKKLIRLLIDETIKLFQYLLQKLIDLIMWIMHWLGYGDK